MKIFIQFDSFQILKNRYKIFYRSFKIIKRKYDVFRPIVKFCGH